MLPCGGIERSKGIERGKKIQGTWSPGGRRATEQQREPASTKQEHESPGAEGGTRQLAFEQQLEPPDGRAAAGATGVESRKLPDRRAVGQQREPPGLRAAVVATGPLSCSSTFVFFLHRCFSNKSSEKDEQQVQYEL